MQYGSVGRYAGALLAPLASLILVLGCSKSNEVEVNEGPSGNNDQVLPACDGGVDPGKQAPEMRHVGRLDGTCIWMDKTEVTRAQYGAFVAAAAASGDAANPEECKGANPAFEPSGGDPLTGDLPMTGIDWCDAAAYCAWAGKQLCGAYTANGMNLSSWETTCTDGDHAGFDYNALASSSTCNGGGSSELKPAGSMGGCITPSLVFDQVGNAREWTAECQGTGAAAECAARGGAFSSTGSDWGCKAKRSFPRTQALPDLGFRCCADSAK